MMAGSDIARSSIKKRTEPSPRRVTDIGKLDLQGAPRGLAESRLDHSLPTTSNRYILCLMDMRDNVRPNPFITRGQDEPQRA